MKHPFVGIGPGRCGTLSLSVIVNSCVNCEAFHEKYLTSWRMNNDDKASLDRMCGQFSSSDYVIGDVSLTHLNKIDWLRDRIPQLKVVCLHRPKEEVAKSWDRWCFGRALPNKNFCETDKDIEWHYRYSPNNNVDALDVWREWWDCAENIMEKVDNAIHLNTKDLNDDQKLNELFDYLEIRPDDRVFDQMRHHHSGTKRLRFL